MTRMKLRLIMNLFADQTSGAAKPADLTFWDRAYLQGLYGAEGQVNRSMQASAMSDHIPPGDRPAEGALPVRHPGSAAPVDALI